MSIQLPTQSRLQVAKVGFVTGDLPFREVLSVKARGIKEVSMLTHGGKLTLPYLQRPAPRSR